MLTKLALLLAVLGVATTARPQNAKPAAERMPVYLPLLQNKRVAVFANHTSTVNGVHLVDTLLARGIKVVKAFGPEHGFRGNADAGAKVGDYVDAKSGVPVISLYGAKRRPTAKDLEDVDLLVFDIQDVGVRFYTYISSLQEFMEAAFEYGKPLMILDRPNPNGHYVDGPVLEPRFKSFVGMQPVPVVYGMTVAEYAMMLAGERWLSPKANARHDYYKTAQNSADTPFHFQIIKCQNYTHKTMYSLPVNPSPNLREMQSIYWYPSTCYFEGTVLSEGRGTDHPFQVFGHPLLPNNLYSFTPAPNTGAAAPKLNGKTCYGWNIHGPVDQVLKAVNNRIKLSWLLNAYKLFPNKDSFFLRPKSGKPDDYFFNKLTGNSSLMEQIKGGKSEAAIRKSWQPGLTKFRAIRKKYLLYAD